MNQTANKTYPEHDCKAWNYQIYGTQDDCFYVKCIICGHLNGVWWFSPWKRIKNLFKRSLGFERSPSNPKE